MEVWKLAIVGIWSSSWKCSAGGLIVLAEFTQLAISLLTRHSPKLHIKLPFLTRETIKLFLLGKIPMPRNQKHMIGDMLPPGQNSFRCW